MPELLRLSDVFDPAQTMFQAEQIRQMRQQNKIRAMEIERARQEAERRARYMQYVGGGDQGVTALAPGVQPVQPGLVPGAGVQAPQLTPPSGTQPQAGFVTPPTGVPQVGPATQGMTQEQTMASRGRKKAEMMMPMINEAIQSKPPNFKMLKKAGQMMKSEDIQALIRQMQFEQLELTSDEEKFEAAWIMTKDWSQEELDSMTKMPGGQVLQALPPGRHTLKYDPVNNRIIPEVTQPKEALLTGTSKAALIDRALHDPSPEGRKRWNAILGRQLEYDIAVARQKVQATMAPPFAQWEEQEKLNAFESYMLNKQKPIFARGDKFSKTQFTRGYNKYIEDLGITAAEAATRGIKYRALAKNVTAQQSKLTSMEEFVASLDAQLERIEPLFEQIGRADQRFLNVPIVKLKNVMIGDPIERELAFKIEEVWNDAARIAGASTESIAQLDVTTQKRYRDIFDVALSINGLRRLMGVARDASHDRLGISKNKYEELLRKMNALTLIRPKKEGRKTIGRFEILAVE